MNTEVTEQGFEPGFLTTDVTVAFSPRLYDRFSKSKKAYWPTVGEIVGEKLLEIKAALDAETRENWTAEDLKNKVIELENIKSKLVRRMIQLVSK